MKNIIEGIKTNKETILKGLATVGALVGIAGIAIVGKKLIGGGTDTEGFESDEPEMDGNE